MIRGIGHVAFDVSDMDKSLHFYCDVLGFTKAFEIENDEGQPWIVYIRVAGLQFIELFYGGQHKPDLPPHSIGFSHLCLEVEDIKQLAEHMHKHGIPLDSGPSRGKDDNWQCWVKDPDGNRIEFMQLSPNSPQMKS
ncbi:VOC family protein [Paenibacillus sediminis]|uniref:Lactoylglutathione lyase n=1 Tax=Paenibacillus sediminis TaxID=664909 RepID=A0ABS4H0S1_9BACL|nr:lactoylglutathione lyase [Paenibacillus sediminis]